MNFLDGKKRWIVAIAVALAGLVRIVTGQDYTVWITALFTSIGWGGELGTPLVDQITSILVTGFAFWAAIDTLLKYRREKRAGASTAEALTPIGGVKLAIAEGLIPPVRIVPPVAAEPLAAARLDDIKAVNKDVASKVA